MEIPPNSQNESAIEKIKTAKMYTFKICYKGTISFQMVMTSYMCICTYMYVYIRKRSKCSHVIIASKSSKGMGEIFPQYQNAHPV